MKLPNKKTLSAWLQARLPPTERTFSEIAQAYLSYPDRARFLRTCAILEKEVEVYDAETGTTVSENRDFKKLAETLLLYHNVLIQEEDQARTIRRAYQHYIVNTDGPIPLGEEEDTFDVFEWARDYAATFNMTLTQTTNANREQETVMTLDDQDNPVRLEEWGRSSGWSSAWSLRRVGHLINHRRYGRDDVIPSVLFPFEPRSPSYSKFNAMWLADLSQLVYRNEGYVKDQLKRWGFEPAIWIEAKDTDTQVFVAAKTDYGVVSFRGTKGVRDFLTDVLIRKEPFDVGGGESHPAGKVHRGFAAAINSVWDQVLAAVNQLGPDRPIFVTGHSLGAALAQLAAIRLAGHGKTVAGVYVYGSPRLGDEAFCAAYNRVLKGQTFLHINDLDLVATIPRAWMGFHHVAQPARRFNKEHEISEYDAESETQEVIPPAEEAEEANRRLMEQAADVILASNSYLDITDPTEMAAHRITYGAVFDEGIVDDHGISQYLFKFACSIVDDKLAAMQ